MGKIGMRERESASRFVQMRNREVGAIDPRFFLHREAASLDIVLRLGIDKKLAKHRGCVNTVSFNSNGSILVSGSDDRMVKLWDWEMGVLKFSFHSGHINNVFQAKFMPYTDDRTMVTCAADGEVRVAKLHDGGRVFTRVLGKHEGRAHKMAVEPGSPFILYSCGEDGRVYHFDLRDQHATRHFKCRTFRDKQFYMPIVNLNAIAIDPRNHNCFAIAGSDEFVRVYDTRRCRWDGKECHNPSDYFCPSHLLGDNHVGVTGLAYSDQSELLASYNFEAIYLFPKDQGLGPDPDVITFEESIDSFIEDQRVRDSLIQVYSGHKNCKTVKGVSFFGLNCEYVTSGSDCGRLFIWRKKGGELLRVMEGDKRIVNCIEANPCTTMLASCGIEKDIKIWLPNAKELAAPVDIKQIMKKNSFRFSSVDFEFDLRHFHDDDDDDDDEDSDSTDFIDIDVLSDNESNDVDFNDESGDDENDDDDDDDDDDDIVMVANDGAESTDTI